MSTYEASRVTITQPDATTLQAALTGFLMADEIWVSSATLERACGGMASGDATSSLAARWTQIRSVPGALTLVERSSPAEVRRARSLHAEATLALRAGRRADAHRLAAQGEAALSVAVAPALQRARHGERLYVDHATSSSLAALGYRVQRVEGRSCVGLYAEKGHHAIAIRINDGGSMEMDVAGLGGGECDRPIAALADQLSRHGLEVEILHQTRHGDDRGGTLIQRAARLAPHNLAVGLVQDVDGQSPPQPAPVLSAAPRQGVRR